MIQAVFHAHEAERFLWIHGVICDFGHKSDVFPRRKRGHEVIELEDKSDMAPAKQGELSFPRSGKVPPSELDGA